MGLTNSNRFRNNLIRNSLVIIMAVPFFSSCTYTFYQSSCAYEVPGAIHKISDLPAELDESSGIETDDSLFYTFNDSGGEPAVYALDDHAGLIRKTVVGNAFNVDWEDIAFDGTNFYVADIGNNRGTRDTLTIYKFNKAFLASASISDRHVERIRFSYEDSTSRNENGMYSHDCEALLCYGDSLYLFTKNWVDLDTRVFVIPNTPGYYRVPPEARYQVNALITASDIDPVKKEVVLLGYRGGIPVLLQYRFTESPAFISCGGKARRYPLKAGTQTEAVCYDQSGRLIITSEKRVHPQSMFVSY